MQRSYAAGFAALGFAVALGVSACGVSQQQEVQLGQQESAQIQQQQQKVQQQQQQQAANTQQPNYPVTQPQAPGLIPGAEMPDPYYGGPEGFAEA